MWNESVDQRQKEQKKLMDSSLQPARRSVSRNCPHDQAEIERAGMDEQTFSDVVPISQMGSSYAAGFVHVRKGAFHPFSALTQHAFASFSPDAPPVLINRGLLFIFPIVALH